MYNREPFFDEWKCPDCGTINNDYVSTCSCGCSQRRAKRLAQNGGQESPPISRNSAVQSQNQSVNAPTGATYASAPVTPPPRPATTTSETTGRNSVRGISGVPASREIPPSPERVAAQQNRPATTSTPSSPRATRNNDREPYFDEWKCPECGTINNDYVTACSCGCTQRRAKRLQQQNKK